MVIRKNFPRDRRGVLLTEMMVAIGILVIAMLPLGFSTLSDGKLFRITYQRAVAMEIVDGEMEILSAGGWRDVPEGRHPYAVQARAATNLPPGNFLLTRSGRHLRLEWLAKKKMGLSPVVREADAP